MTMDDDAILDATLRDFLRARASDTAGIRDASTMAAAITHRIPTRPRSAVGVPSGRLAWIALAALLAILALATAIGSRPSPAPLIVTNGSIVYVNETGPGEIFLVRRGGRPSTVTGRGIREYPYLGACPAFSPDGTMLVYGAQDGDLVLATVDPEGRIRGDSRDVQVPGSEDPHCVTWAPNSSAFAFFDGTVVIVPVDGPIRQVQGIGQGAVDPPGTFPTSHPADRAIAWSPDGHTIAVARPDGVWLAPVDGGEVRRLIDNPAISLSWAPDSTRLVVGVAPADPEPGATEAAAVIDATDGSVEATIPKGFRPPVWSPVDDRIALSDASGAVVVVRPDGTRLALVDDYGYNVTWSPDGRLLMYIQDVGPAEWALLTAAAEVKAVEVV